MVFLTMINIMKKLLFTTHPLAIFAEHISKGNNMFFLSVLQGQFLHFDLFLFSELLIFCICFVAGS